MERAVKRFFRPTLGAALLGLALRTAWADPVAFAGKVVDGAGNPVPWAFVSVEGASIAGQSGADGTFSLSGNAPAALYPDPKPPAGFAPIEPGLRARYRADGRITAGSVASVLLWAHPSGGLPAIGSLPAFSASGEERPPTAPSLAEAARTAAAGWTITVAMAHFETGSFPQAAATAKGLVLALAPSKTDTAFYAAEKKACLDTLNALRASIGKPKVAWSKSLEAFADQGVRYDAALGKAHAHFGAYSLRAVPADAENAIPGWPLKSYKTVTAVVNAGAKMMWDEGPGGGHYDNIAGDQKEAGCGIYVTPQGNVWIIHDFK